MVKVASVGVVSDSPTGCTGNVHHNSFGHRVEMNRHYVSVGIIYVSDRLIYKSLAYCCLYAKHHVHYLMLRTTSPKRDGSLQTSRTLQTSNVNTCTDRQFSSMKQEHHQ